jgi:hypothetical protein
MAVVSSYLILYEIQADPADETNETVVIVRIVASRRDLIGIFD